MKVWFLNSSAYPFLPPVEDYDSVRVTLPSRYYDPIKGAELFDRYLDESLLVEDEGMEILLNEHHQAPHYVGPAAPIMAGILARSTKRARILILGNPVANRREPIRVAEEMALLDVLSKGRIEVGFVRGVPSEVASANSNPVNMQGRLWEAMDVIIKAWTQHDGPFTHEGKYFHHRMINVWPRAFQEPHPPVWVSSLSEDGAAEIGRRGHILATMLTGFDGTRRIFDSYRDAWRAEGRGSAVPVMQLAYTALVYTGKSEAEGRSGAEKLRWFITSSKVARPFTAPPGYGSVANQVRALRGGDISPRSKFGGEPTVDRLIEAGVLFAGSPESVFQQIKRLYDHVGGFGHLLVMGQTGFLSHEETVKGIQTFAREVYPRLKAELPDLAVCQPFGS